MQDRIKHTTVNVFYYWISPDFNSFKSYSKSSNSLKIFINSFSCALKTKL